VLIAVSVVAAACGSTDTSDLSQQAREGRDLAMSKGCAASHGDVGEGGVGPAWSGLAGSDVELADGSTVTTDAEYLRRSITDPEAQVAAGFTITMPTTNSLTQRSLP
jgi:cytochrome c oxidase subunit 2